MEPRNPHSSRVAFWCREGRLQRCAAKGLVQRTRRGRRARHTFGGISRNLGEPDFFHVRAW